MFWTPLWRAPVSGATVLMPNGHWSMIDTLFNAETKTINTVNAKAHLTHQDHTSEIQKQLHYIKNMEKKTSKTKWK